MRKEIEWGSVVYSFGKIQRSTNYYCDNEAEFWVMYDTLTYDGNAVTAWIEDLKLCIEENIPVEEYRREMNGEEEE